MVDILVTLETTVFRKCQINMNASQRHEIFTTSERVPASKTDLSQTLPVKQPADGEIKLPGWTTFHELPSFEDVLSVTRPVRGYIRCACHNLWQKV